VIKEVFSGKRAGKKELLKIRKIILGSGSLDYAKNEIKRTTCEAECNIKSLKIGKDCRRALENFTKKILST